MMFARHTTGLAHDPRSQQVLKWAQPNPTFDISLDHPMDYLLPT
jgi:hypothetical protein